MRDPGGWIETFTHRQFFPLDPDPNEIVIEDIAHALSQQVRYSGHVPEPYTVAQHSVLVSHLADRLAIDAGGLGGSGPIDMAEIALWGLMHDASEAYCVDLPRPIKKQLPRYSEAEDLVQRAVCTRFDLSPDMPGAVHEADDIVLASEASLFFPEATRPGDWPLRRVPDMEVIGWLRHVRDHREAENDFLDRFDALTRILRRGRL